MPRGFVFRLETVLRMRRRAFDEKQRTVARRLREIRRRESMIAAIFEQVSAQAAAARVEQNKELLDVALIRGHRSHGTFLLGRIEQLREETRRHEALLQQEREEMVKASVAFKAIEKLRERRLARYHEEQSRRDQKEQNEIAIEMHRRRRLMDSARPEAIEAPLGQ